MHRDPRPGGDDRGNIFGVNGLLEEGGFFFFLFRPSASAFDGKVLAFEGLKIFLRLRQFAVGDLGHTQKVAVALGHFHFAL